MALVLFRYRKMLMFSMLLYAVVQFVSVANLHHDGLLIMVIGIIPPSIAAFIMFSVARMYTANFRRFWLILASGSTCYGLLVCIQFIMSGFPPIITFADGQPGLVALWHLPALLCAVSFGFLIMRGLSKYNGIRFMLDMTVLTVLLGSCCWIYMFDPIISSLSKQEAKVSIVVNGLYPLSCFALLGMLLILYVTARPLFPKIVYVMLAVGMLCFSIGTTFNFLINTDYSVTAGKWADPIYSVGLFSFTMAAIYFSGQYSGQIAPGRQPSAKRGRKWAKADYFAPFVSLLLLPIVILTFPETEKINIIAAAGVVTVIIAAIRQCTVLLEMDAVMRNSVRMQERTQYLVSYDPLSDLPNRQFFETSVNKALQQKPTDSTFSTANWHLAVMIIDLDRFNYINDSYGHHIGDQIIQLIAQRLKERQNRRITIARQGGDEFVLLVIGSCNRAELQRWAETLLEIVADPLHIGSLELRMTGSIGIATAPSDGMSAAELMKNADTALYTAKARGRNKYCFYTPELKHHLTKTLAMEQSLRKALEQEEFVLHYQPQVRASDGKLVGVEALIRWQPSDGALVSPAEFIPLAEETGMIVPIGEWVIRTACRQAAIWMEEGGKDIQISVNVSPRQFDEADFGEQVMSILEETGLPPERLVLELTESIAIRDEEKTVAKLHALKRHGVQIAIDDFGTGYSSFGYLKLFCVDTLKIAQTFIREVPDHSEQGAIVTAMIAMAKSLKLEVTVEGVETKEQAEFLREQGCDWIQGYYYAKPLSASEFAHYRRTGGSITSQSTLQ